MPKQKNQESRPFRILDYPLFDMARIVAIVHANIVRRAPCALTPSKWRVIAHLGEQNILTIKELAELAVLERSALTPAGRQLYDQCAQIAKSEIEFALSVLNEVELQQLRGYLARVRDNVVLHSQRSARDDWAAE
jgi:DNA-binding MarR family transcriptional regulator